MAVITFVPTEKVRTNEPVSPFEHHLSFLFFFDGPNWDLSSSLPLGVACRLSEGHAAGSLANNIVASVYIAFRPREQNSCCFDSGLFVVFVVAVHGRRSLMHE